MSDININLLLNSAFTKGRQTLWLGMVARSDAHLPSIQMVASSILQSGKYSFLVIGHEIISTAILSQPLIQLVHLSVYGKRMCTKYLVNLG